ncbi:MAG TPA: glycosyltransferase family A protein [Deltaproteobacteria bacterium]|nr:glycosyltransferase family A protein [Deltaproteobacteria bacterium]HPJ92639.1 glycosyltransferase family A protein [Deltaproteobacteria bacterium]HPR55225.1 glycosyltransferase family A protein [Deltaproteobacteria bacterium]
MSEIIPGIQITIPAYNCVDTIGKTLESTRNQDYDHERVFTIVVDFGSTDGTYEKLLGEDPYHLGVFQVTGKRYGDSMASDAVAFHEYQPAGISPTYSLLLWPGEVIYPSFLKTATEVMIRNREHSPKLLICETDVCGEDGTVKKQEPLYNGDCIINGELDFKEYLTHGNRHNILCFGGNINKCKNIQARIANDRRHWMKCINLNMNANCIYLSKALACVRETTYGDEVEEVLLRWVMNINTMRGYLAKYGRCIDDQFETLSQRNVASYALWRSYITQKKGLYTQAQDCYLLAEAIYPGIVSENVWAMVTRHLNNPDDDTRQWLERHFGDEEIREALHNPINR